MSPLLASGLELMLVGMGTVFVFLTLLVLATMLMSKTLQRLLPTEAAAHATNTVHVAAISAAIAEHRKRGRRTE